jgi:hypothetical protein
MTTTTTEEIPLPPGTKTSPMRRTLRKVSTLNNSLIIGIPNIIAEMAGAEHGDPMKIWYEPGSPKGRIIIEKKY